MSTMLEPAERAFLAHLEDGPFRIGMAEGRWGLADPSLLPDGLVWPISVLWVAAAPREKSPNRFYLRLDCNNYPVDAPTGTFWDLVTKDILAIHKRPKGTGRVQLVFRTDWEGGRAFYHPYDRVAAASHRDWATQHPQRVWNRDKTIFDYLSEIYGLLNSNEYTGI